MRPDLWLTKRPYLTSLKVLEMRLSTFKADEIPVTFIVFEGRENVS